jgi:hypothetical protein
MAKKNNLHSQAFLIWLIGQKRKKHGLLTATQAKNKNFRYEHVRRLTGTYQPETVMNRVHAQPTSPNKKQDLSNSFFNLETHKLSMLVPEIRFYKVQGSKMIPFYFPITSDYSPLEAGILSPEYTGYSGGNSVIESFNVVLRGTDPFTAKRYLEASLTLKVDSLANIFIKQPGYARLADLFTISVPASKTHTSHGASIKAGQLMRPIEIAASLGYATRTADNDVFSEEEQREIGKNSMVLRMNVTDHTINVGKDGTATVTIQYVARISSFDESPAAFSLTHNSDDIAVDARIKTLDQPQGDDIDSTAKSKETKSALENEQAQIKKIVNKINEIRKVTETLENKGRFFREEPTPAALRKYLKPSTPSENPDAEEPDTSAETAVVSRAPISDPTKTSSKEKIKKHGQKQIQKLDSAMRTAHYFIFGDMIEAFCITRRKAMQGAIANLKVKKTNGNLTNSEFAKRVKIINDNLTKLKSFKILLPDIKLVYPKGNPIIINLADIPISTDLYQRYVFNEIINTKGTTYSITDFLSHCVSKILPQAIGGFEKKAPYVLKNTKQVFASTSFTGAEVLPSLGSANISVDKISGPTAGSSFSNEKEDEYFIIYPEPDADVPTSRSGNETSDFEDNIYHFHLGKDRGIIKNISFKKFTVPFRQEALMTNQVGLYDELKMPYSANINMFGNMLFYPGSQLYIDPFSIGFGDPRDANSAATDLGLGGYYIILSVDTSYSSAGTLNTSLECSFASWVKPTPMGQSTGPEEDVHEADETESSASESLDPETADEPPVFESSDFDGQIVHNVEIQGESYASDWVIESHDPIPGEDNEYGSMVIMRQSGYDPPPAQTAIMTPWPDPDTSAEGSSSRALAQNPAPTPGAEYADADEE